MKIRVYYEDTDVGGIVYHTNYLKYCERARSESFFKRGLSPIINDTHFVVRKIECEFLSPAYFGDTVEVSTSIKEIKKASFILFQEIKRDQKVLFISTTTLVFVKDKKIKRVDKELRDIILDIWEN